MRANVIAGKFKRIDSPANPTIKHIRALALKKRREESRMFLAEGARLIEDALAQGWPVRTLIYGRSMAAEPRLQDLAARARARGADILEVGDKVLAAISRRDNPQTAIAVIGQKWSDNWRHPPGADDFWIALDRVRDPGNLGAIIRTADAAGAKGVVLIGDCADPFSLEAVRATMGSIFNIGLARMNMAEFTSWRARWPGLLIGTHLAGQRDYRQIDYQGRPVMLLMGNEQSGISDELAAICDELCRIPMAGRADSLNLAVATGIMAFEIRRSALALPEEKNE